MIAEMDERDCPLLSLLIGGNIAEWLRSSPLHLLSSGGGAG